VEYSLGLQQGRVRTQSQTFQSFEAASSTSTPNTPTILPQTPISAPPILSAPSPVNTPTTIVTQAPQSAAVQVQSTQQNLQPQQQQFQQIQPTPQLQIQTPIMLGERKRGSIKGIKKTKKRLGGTSTKDLGRFKATDDLALIIGIQQTNDIKAVLRGVKFSCKFTYQELSHRWNSLMYDESISRIAISCIRNLHPEMIASIQQKALFSKAEEDILTNIKSTETPSEEFFEDLLRKNANVFYHARTPKSLLIHWELMRAYMLLTDQVIPSVTSTEGMPTFSDYEDNLNDNEILAENRDEHLEIELQLADRKNKKEIRVLENELQRWSVLLESVTGVGISPEFDNQTLAILRGRSVRYLMRSREITFGRSSKELTVDVNLALEGPAYKVSRKQGTIKMRSNGDFFLANEGKRPVFVDGTPIIESNKIKLHNNNVIEVNN
jgi:microspherule protein 1